MELALAAGLALAGYGLVDTDKKINTISQMRRDNMYDSGQLERSKNALYDRATKFNKLSKRTANTGIVPTNANRLPDRRAWENSRESDLDGASFATFDSLSSEESGAAPNWMATETKLRQAPKQGKNNNEGSYMEQFQPIRFDNPGRAVGSNDVSNNISGNSMIKSEAGMALDGGWSNYSKKDMTYGVVAPGELDYFRKTQLVPYFSAKSYGGSGDAKRRDGNIQGRLELFTGADELKPSKKEVTPLFAPIKNSGNVFGTPVMTEYEMDRYYVSGRRDGEKPFQPVQVSPGLDIDYMQTGSGALQPSYDYRPLPKTIDELRLANKQQVSYTAPVVQGQKGSVRGVHAAVNKNRPYRIAANKQSDLQRSSFITSAPKTRENYSLGKTLREDTHVSYVGGAAAVTNLGDNGSYNLRGKVNPTTRIKLAGYDPGPAGQTGAGGIRREQHQLYDNQRMGTEHTQFLGGGHQTSMGTAYNPNDIPDPTIRAMTGIDSAGYSTITGSARYGQVPHTDEARPTLRQTLPDALPMGSVTGDYRATTATDYTDVRGHTGRELIENNPYSGFITNSVGQMPASWDQLAINFKETTLQPQVGAGFSGSGEGSWTRGDLVLDPTMRQMTSQHLLGTVGQSRDGGYMANPQQAIANQRQTMEQNRQIRGAHQGAHQGGYATNPQCAPTTLKQLMEGTYMVGGAAQAGQQGGYGSNPQQSFTTLRQGTEGTHHIGSAGVAGQQGGYGANPQQSFTTLRQLYEGTSQVGSAAVAGQYGGYGSNPQQAMDTLRQGYETTAHIGGADNAGQMGGYGSNPQQAMDTLRQGYETTAHIGGADNAGQMGGYCSNPQEVPHTLRQLYETTQYLGGTAAGVTTGGYGTNPVEMRKTARQGTHAERRGGGNAAVDMHTPYSSYYRAETVDKTMDGRPIAGNIQVGYNNDLTSYRHRDVQNSARMENGGAANPGYGNGMGEWTRAGITTPQENVRLDPVLIAQLDSNPYNIPHFTSGADYGRQDGYCQNGMDTSAFTQL
jgi:hypothetical protein